MTLKEIEEKVTQRMTFSASSSHQADIFVQQFLQHQADKMIAVSAVKTGIPTAVTYYINCCSSSVRCIVALTIENAYNLGYGGTGPHTFVDHLYKLGFDICQDDEDLILGRVGNCTRFFATAP